MIKGSEKGVFEYYQKHMIAYNQVFSKENQFTKTVLEDLARFCRAHQSTFHKDAKVHALLEGRREVFLRIAEYIGLSPDELLTLHKVKQLKTE